VAGLVERCRADDIRARLVQVDYASHSAHVEPVRDRLLAALGSLSPARSEIGFYSTVTGDRFDTTGLTTDYWYANLRQPVQFDRAGRAVAEAGQDVFIECSPHPMLGLGIEESLPGAVVVGSLRRDSPVWPSLLGSIAALHVQGANISWHDLFPGQARLSLP